MTSAPEQGTPEPNTPEQDSAEEIARKRYFGLQMMRVLALGLVLAGFAITRGVLPAPFWLGAGMAVIGVVAFFFAPPLLAKRWKAQDRGEA